MSDPDVMNPGDVRRRWIVWAFGLAAIAGAVWLQVPTLMWNIEHGFYFWGGSGKAEIQTYWNLATVVIDLTVLVVWTLRRPRQWWWPPVVGGVVFLAGWVVAFPLGVVLAMLTPRLG